MGFINDLRKAVSAFAKYEPMTDPASMLGSQASYTTRSPASRPRPMIADTSIMSSLYTRIAIDVAAIPIRHVSLDKEGRFTGLRDSYLNECLAVSPNMDQVPTQFMMDVVLSLFDDGATAIVPIDTSADPEKSDSYDIYSLRVGKIVAWYPKHIRVSCWNEDKGARQEFVVSKQVAAIVENPLGNVMNAPNGTLTRLMQKLHQLDMLDDKISSGKLDIIIQLPYTLRNELLRNRAETRRQEMEDQLANSTYGVAYAEANDKITQLNRPADNNMLEQIKRLHGQLYSQLGLTEGVFDGTASEAEMLNYRNRTVKPILEAIRASMHRSWLSKTARTQGQAIMYLPNPFDLMPLSQFAEIGDKLIRNQVVTPNELRQGIGMKPHESPAADQLNNPNMPGGPQGETVTVSPDASATSLVEENEQMSKELGITK